jgi:hypothetical protein
MNKKLQKTKKSRRDKQKEQELVREIERTQDEIERRIEVLSKRVKVYEH